MNNDSELYFELELMRNCQYFILSKSGFFRINRTNNKKRR